MDHAAGCFGNTAQRPSGEILLCAENTSISRIILGSDLNPDLGMVSVHGEASAFGPASGYRV
jgi:hypothetical protein